MAIIGISGKKNSGKDLVGRIIQYLTSTDKDKYDDFEEWDMHHISLVLSSKWEIRKFADKLKDIICLLIDCTREQLEDEEFKNTELGEEWWKYEQFDKSYKDWVLTTKFFYDKHHRITPEEFRVIKPTPRFLLQNIGTDLFRNHLHPDIWINSLMKNIDKDVILTDLRFKNELKAIKDRDGITIRVNRAMEVLTNKQHPSETALDSAEFDYVIENNSDIPSLIKKVEEVLINEFLNNEELWN